MIWLWIGFISLILVLLALDLGVFHREAKAVSVREAFAWTAVWVTVAISFSIFVHFAYENHLFGIGGTPDPVDGMINDGRLALVKYLTGYVIEWSLSVDNVFVMAMIFSSLRIPAEYQHRVLFWGILGAMVMRGVMILIGAQLVARYHWILLVFGVFLIITAIRMAVQKDDHEDADPSKGFVLRTVRRFFPVSAKYNGSHFTAIENGRRVLTPLAVALVLVETTDLIFAVDSIPAIFAITTDPFIVYTSNVFAILGLRALYFLLAGVIHKFHYLKLGLSIVLVFVGTKMLLEDVLHIPIGISLGVVAGVLAISVIASLLFPKEVEEHSPITSHGEGQEGVDGSGFERGGEAPVGPSDGEKPED